MSPELLGTRAGYSWVPGLEDVGLMGTQAPTTNIGLHSLWEEAQPRQRPQPKPSSLPKHLIAEPSGSAHPCGSGKEPLLLGWGSGMGPVPQIQAGVS